MSVMPEWFQEQEQEEKASERQERLDEWRRIAKMLRDLEYIKVPVKGECFQRIRQRHPHRTDGGKTMTELKTCPICKGTRICMDGGDNTYHPRCLDCGCTAPFDAWQSRIPAPAEVEKLEQDLEQYITLGSTGCRTIAEDVEFNRLHSKFLAALTNTTPYLSQDVNVPVRGE
jgi:hypothetical protein